MFDIGWSELLLIAVIAIVVVGPRDLPRLMRTVGQYSSKLRSMSRDLRKQFDEAVREAELDDVRKSLTDLKTPDPVRQIREAVTKPVEELKSTVAEAGRLDGAGADETSAAKDRASKDAAAPASGEGEPTPAAAENDAPEPGLSPSSEGREAEPTRAASAT